MSQKTKSPYPVEVTWHDAWSRAGWTQLDMVGDEPAVVVSYGWLLRRTKKALTMALSKFSQSTYGEYLILPIECVKRVRRV
jgi:hypothetical protein